MSRTIPFFNYPALFRVREREILDTVARVLGGGKLILQEDLERFEANLASYLGVRHALGVANGTDALMLALRACDVGPGDEVILPSHTFIATASAVHQAGARPVLVDAQDDHCVDPAAVRAAVTDRTRALMPVQLNGRVCDMPALQEIADEHGLMIIEDAAQALGAELGGRKAGTFGRAAGFSFYPAKLLGCYGDGGAVVTDDPTVAERLRELRDHGRREDGDIRFWSYNSRLDNVQAALLDLKLPGLPGELERRREIASMYHERLSGFPDLLLPPGPDAADRYDVYQNYEIEVPRRDELRTHLKQKGVSTIIQWGGRAVHQFQRLGFDQTLPVTERIMANSLLLPMNVSLSDDDVSYICDAVGSFFGAPVAA